MASYHFYSVFLHLRAPGSISRPQQASEEIIIKMIITAILVEFWPALCVPGVSFLYLFQVPLFSGGSQGQEVHGSHCCPSELLGARERGEISLPSHLMPQFSLLGQVDHTVKSGSWLGLGKHFIHEVVTGFRLYVLSPDSPLPQPFLHFSVAVMCHWFPLTFGENSLSMTCFVPANPQSIWHPVQSLFREK